MKYNITLLVILGVLVIPCTAIPWCETQNLFFWNGSSDITGYRVLNNVPEQDSQRTIKTTVTNASEVTIGNWITPIGAPGALRWSPGVFTFRTYIYVSSATDRTTIKFYIVNRSATGVETNLFYNSAITKDIDDVGTPQENIFSYARRNYTTLFPGDRLVIRINGSTTSMTPRQVLIDLAGSTNASMVSASYFDCPTESADSGGGSGAGIALATGLVGGILGAIILSRRKT